jgi:hypothetical protein
VDEVRRVETVLQQIPVWFDVLNRCQLLPERRSSDGETLAILWNTAFAHWVIDEQIVSQPLTREELAVFQRTLLATAVEEEARRFSTLLSSRLSLPAEEMAASQGLVVFALGKLKEVLSVDAKTADLRFTGGILIAA